MASFAVRTALSGPIWRGHAGVSRKIGPLSKASGSGLRVDGSVDAGRDDVLDVLGVLVEYERLGVGEGHVELQCRAAPPAVGDMDQPERRLSERVQLEVGSGRLELDSALVGAEGPGQLRAFG